MSQFYQMTLEEAIALHQEKDLSTYALLKLYIKIKFKPGWRVEIDREKVMQELGITIHQFRRALTRLRKEIQIFVKKIIRLAFYAPDETKIRAEREPRSHCLRTDVAQDAHSDRQNPSSNRSSSDRPDLSSDLSSDLLSDKKPKLGLPEKLDSLPEGERQEFANFAWDRVANMPERPSLPKRWIVAHFEDLYEDFQRAKSPQTQKTKEKEFTKWYDLMRKLGHVRGQRKDGDRLIVQRSTGEWQEVDELINQGWTLEYLQKRVKR